MSINYDVLVVDDRMLDAQETLVALEQVAPRATVLHLDSGREALAYLFSVGEFAGRPPVMPQLVLLSEEMSDISGLCVLDLMRAHPMTRNVPIVLLSLGSDLREFRRHDSFRADAYVIKPVDFQRYCAVIQGCIRCWLPWALRPSACRDLRPQRVAQAATRKSPDVAGDCLKSSAFPVSGLRQVGWERLKLMLLHLATKRPGRSQISA